MTKDVGQLVDEVLGESDRPKLAYQRLDFGPGTESSSAHPDAYTRMFSSDLGSRAVGRVGNESLTLSILSDFATELLIGAIRLPHRGGETLIFKRGAGKDVVLLLDPDMPKQDGLVRVSDAFSIDLAAAGKASEARLAVAAGHRQAEHYLGSRHHRDIAAMLLSGGDTALGQMLWIAQPEVLRAPMPEMEELGCPSPALEIRCDRRDERPQLSSVGMFCRDAGGQIGVTASLHGTGPTGTKIMLGGLPAEVKHHSEVQDLVFVTLPPDYAIPALARGTKGPRQDGEPAKNEAVSFEGCKNARSTIVSATSDGLSWIDPSSQNKVHTPPVVDRGDSGCALVDGQDRVIGFAFRRTKYDAPLQWAEWIWAANALAALKLEPL